MKKQFDAIIIGAGQAGPSLAARLANSGMNVAICERKLFGGTCVNTGCIPTKTLVASAYIAHKMRHAEEYGVSVNGTIKIDMQKVKARKDAIVNKSKKNVESWLRSTKNCQVFTGQAVFLDTNTIRVGDDLLHAKKIFINVGERAFVPPMPGVEDVNYFTNSDMMDLDFVPEHLVIIGGSYIGLEFGQMYKRFGSKVTIIEKNSRLIPREDEDVSAAVKEILEKEGINIRLNAECIQMREQGEMIQINLDCESESREVLGSHLLLAVGRRPNTDDLALDKAGIQTNERGHIIVDETLQTTNPGIYALGDCNGKGAFTHTSYNDYEIVADNLLNNASRSIYDRIVTYGLFIDPPLARVGMSEKQVRESGRKILVCERPMTRVGRAVEKGETQGFMKAFVDAESQEILGAVILGTGGDEAIHCILDVMYAKKPYTLITHAVHIHPTLAELIPTMFAELKPLK